MTFGISWLANNSNLALYSESPGMAYLGQPSYYASLDAVKDLYRISCVNQPLVFIEIVNATDCVAIQDVTQVSTGVWEIKVLNCTYSTRLNNAPTKCSPTLHCFAPLSSGSGSSYGLRMWDSSGNITFDSNSGMLIPKQFSDAAAYSGAGEGVSSYSYSGLTRPAFVAHGSGGSGARQQRIGLTSSADSYTYGQVWNSNAAGVLYRVAQVVLHTVVNSSISNPWTMRYSANTILFTDISLYV